ncbi:glycosyltransferase [Longispora sp. K20-0274]|uniref:glycosyltransferase family 2 protein n=1 Tax=Longispora sp. K20-0274 TaxID=3088255 RepID=UPI00399B96DE
MQAAVRSVLAQTDSDWRLTVVDDGVAPGVPEWFATITDERVRYQRNEQNLGVTGNYKKCIGLVEFDHVVMMGTDDIMLPNYLECVRSVLAEYPDVAMIQPGVEVIDGNGEVVRTLVDEAKRRLYAPRTQTRRVMAGEELAKSLLRGNWLYFPSICWRVDALRDVGFRSDLEVIQDLALVIDLLQRGDSMAIDPVVCFQYRRHTISISATGAVAGTRFTEARNYFLDVADRMDSHGWPKAARIARRYMSSRIHAVTLLPAAIRARHRAGVVNLSRHAFGPSRRSF